MNLRHLRILLFVAATAPLISAQSWSANVSIFSTGFDNPRGLKFGPDGNLYVAEAGLGGTTNTASICPELQLPPELGGLALNGPTARISKVTPGSARSTHLANLPSVIFPWGDIYGVSDVAFIGGTMYAVLMGAGCENGSTTPLSVIRVNDSGSSPEWQVVADLGKYRLHHTVAFPATYDASFEGVWYSMIAIRGQLYALDANHGEIVSVDPSGAISQFVDISSYFGHGIPTALAWHGNLYVGTLGLFAPIQAGAQSVSKVNPDGKLKVTDTGFTAVLGIAFDNRDRLYVLETSGAGFDFPAPNTGRIVRRNPSGTTDVIATGLDRPSAMTYGPDGLLYVSEVGYGEFSPGLGRILRVTIPD
jgi:hypothetical protein